jgi:hypothetical protein
MVYPFQFDYSYRVTARRSVDTCFTELMTGMNLLNWCGIHTNTRFDLISEDELKDVASSVVAIHTRFQQFLPELLTGLHHAIPEKIADARPLVFEHHRRK